MAAAQLCSMGDSCGVCKKSSGHAADGGCEEAVFREEASWSLGVRGFSAEKKSASVSAICGKFHIMSDGYYRYSRFGQLPQNFNNPLF